MVARVDVKRRLVHVKSSHGLNCCNYGEIVLFKENKDGDYVDDFSEIDLGIEYSTESD